MYNFETFRLHTNETLVSNSENLAGLNHYFYELIKGKYLSTTIKMFAFRNGTFYELLRSISVLISWHILIANSANISRKTGLVNNFVQLKDAALNFCNFDFNENHIKELTEIRLSESAKKANVETRQILNEINIFNFNLTLNSTTYKNDESIAGKVLHYLIIFSF